MYFKLVPRRAEAGDLGRMADPGDDPEVGAVRAEMDLLRGAACHRKPGARSTIILGRNPSPLDNGNKTIRIIKTVRGNETVKISHRLGLGRHDI